MSGLIKYLAGFFDGEGSITFLKNERVYIQIGQVGEQPLELYAKVFGGAVQFNKITKGRLPYYQYQTTDNKRCGKILSSLYPYLLVKQEKAQVALARLGLPVPTSSDIVSTEYCGGFFDAEGSVSTYVRKGSSNIEPHIQVGQNNPYPLLVFQQMYGGYLHERRNVSISGSKVFNWLLKRSNITSFCNEMIPHTILKREQLKLMKIFVSINLRCSKRDFSRQDKVEDKLELALEIKLLNDRVDLREEVDDMFCE